MNYCHNCGRQLPDEDRFCNNCGKAVAAGEQGTEALPGNWPLQDDSKTELSMADYYIAPESVSDEIYRGASESDSDKETSALLISESSNDIAKNQQSTHASRKDGTRAIFTRETNAATMNKASNMPHREVEPNVREIGRSGNSEVFGRLKNGHLLDGRYVINATIGSGGQGVVYLASDSKIGTLCAVKEIDLSGGLSIGLLAEPDILKQLRHPRLPRINDIIEKDNYLYIVEEYFEGVPLKELISHRKNCSEKNVLIWFQQLAEILNYLHSFKPRPIIYRDMKPSNIIIDSQNEVRLIDFGIAREYKAEQDSDTRYIGTRGYAAPEQYGGNQTDARTDIYALGVSMYHVLTGKSPLEPPYQPLPVRQIDPGLSEGIEKIIQKCIKVNPAERYQTAAELLNDLRNIHTLNREYRVHRLKVRSLIMLALFLVIASGWGINYLYQSKQDEKKANFDAYLQAGIQAYNSRNYTLAEEEFIRAISVMKEPEAYIDLAKTYLKQNENDNVISLLQENINNGLLANNNEIKYIIGTAYYQEEKYKEAIPYFKAVVDSSTVKSEDDVAAYRDLAISYAKIGSLDLAQQTLDQINSNSQFADHIAHFVKGELAVLRRDYGLAVQEFETAVRLDGQNVHYKTSLARLYISLNVQQQDTVSINSNYKNAFTQLEEALLLEPGNILVLNDLAEDYYNYGVWCESLGDSKSREMYQKSLASFKKISDMGTDDADIFVNTGILYEKLGESDRADSAYSRAIELDGNNSRANLVYGLYKLRTGDYAGSIEYLNKTIHLNDNPGEVATARSKINELKQKGWIT